MWYIAACDNEGKCIGFLRKDKSISTTPDDELDNLMSFKKKADTNELVLQINLGHILLPGGWEFRVTPVRG